MLKWLFAFGSMFLTKQWFEHYRDTGDNSIQGFLEYLKDKYYTKH